MKAVTMYRPYSIGKALEDFDRYVDAFFGESPLTPARRNVRIPAVDVRETENAWEIDAELPGFDEKDISVQIEGNVLSLEAKTESHDERHGGEQPDSERKDDDRRYLIRERRSAAFNRTFRLPENANPESVSATYRNGVLSLSVGKRQETQKKLVKIN